MELKGIVRSLSEIEKPVLVALEGKNSVSLPDIEVKTGLKIDSVRRAVGWLKEKGLVELEEKTVAGFALTPAGKSSLRKGLPEKMFIEALHAAGGKATLEDVRRSSKLNVPELNASMGLAKRNAWISIRKDGETFLELTGLEKDLMDGKHWAEVLIKKIEAKEQLSGEEKNKAKELVKRGLAEELETKEVKLRISENGLKALGMPEFREARAYNIQDAVPRLYPGKKQPYIQFLNIIRRKLIQLGFKEMYAPLITQEFYNFDVLFQPQNHPARSWTDTYQLKAPRKGRLPHRRIVNSVKAAHEHGGNTESIGWRYTWSEDIAEKVMPAAHGTAHSARQLVQGIEVPGKYFAIARCYRPDVIDASHLIEFNQLEGFIVGENLNFRSLLGMLKQFATEIAGAEAVKFYPDYYPFTEPSVQLSAKHPKLGWVEFAGAGIFRPEMMHALGIEEPAIAWGMGIDRLAMFKLGIKDIRYLFSDDLDWLRESRMVRE